MKENYSTTFFAPELFINNRVKDISFYKEAFGASERMRFTNDDGGIHVVELSINGAIFHIHEITAKKFFFSPDKNNGTTVCVGLFVSDVDEVMRKAIKAGAIEINPAQDYDYGYRQGTIKDPFGHYWQIQKKIS
jgi:PhnB protein